MTKRERNYLLNKRIQKLVNQYMRTTSSFTLDIKGSYLMYGCAGTKTWKDENNIVHVEILDYETIQELLKLKKEEIPDEYTIICDE